MFLIFDRNLRQISWRVSRDHPLFRGCDEVARKHIEFIAICQFTSFGWARCEESLGIWFSLEIWVNYSIERIHLVWGLAGRVACWSWLELAVVFFEFNRGVWLFHGWLCCVVSTKKTGRSLFDSESNNTLFKISFRSRWCFTFEPNRFQLNSWDTSTLRQSRTRPWIILSSKVNCSIRPIPYSLSCPRPGRLRR